MAQGDEGFDFVGGLGAPAADGGWWGDFHSCEGVLKESRQGGEGCFGMLAEVLEAERVVAIGE